MDRTKSDKVKQKAKGGEGHGGQYNRQHTMHKQTHGPRTNILQAKKSVPSEFSNPNPCLRSQQATPPTAPDQGHK